MTIFDFYKILKLDKEAEALSSASAEQQRETEDELDELELDLLSAAGRDPAPPLKWNNTPYG